MSSRRTAILVTVAVVAGSVVAGVGLATQGSTKPSPVVQIDENRGRIGSVVLGETRQNVIGVLGKPTLEKGLPLPGTNPTVTVDRLTYPHLTVQLRDGAVFSIETDSPGARTLKVVRIGDPLSAARALYRKASHCIPNSPDTTAPHPHCRITVPSGELLITGDPIETMTLVSTRS
jgi:hypothetical protein